MSRVTDLHLEHCRQLFLGERFAALPPLVRHRLGGACRELSQLEDEIAARLGSRTPPRLLLIDEEQALILGSIERAEIEREVSRGAAAGARD